MKKISSIVLAALSATSFGAMAAENSINVPFSGSAEAGCIIITPPANAGFGAVPVGQPGWRQIDVELLCTDGQAYSFRPNSTSVSVTSSVGETVTIRMFDQSKSVLQQAGMGMGFTGNGQKQTVSFQLKAEGQGEMINGSNVFTKSGTFSGSFPLILSY